MKAKYAIGAVLLSLLAFQSVAGTGDLFTGIGQAVESLASDLDAKVTKIADDISTKIGNTKSAVDAIKDSAVAVDAAKSTAAGVILSDMQFTKPIDGFCTGTPACLQVVTPPVYAQPQFKCPEGFLLTTVSGQTTCIKKDTKCPKDTSYVQGSCCSPCPEGTSQNGAYCYAPSNTYCYMSEDACPSDCESTQVCKEFLKIQKCSYKCCKEENPIVPVACSPAPVKVTYADAIIMCPIGSQLDSDSFRCIVTPAACLSAQRRVCCATAVTTASAPAQSPTLALMHASSCAHALPS